MLTPILKMNVTKNKGKKMTWETAREVFLKQKAEGLDPLMIKFQNEFFVTDRLTHFEKCKEVGHEEAVKMVAQ